MTYIGPQLESVFSAAIAKGPCHEIDLFRALLKAFASLHGRAVGEEYHGAKSHVVFSAKRGAGRASPRCELADLLLLTFRAGDASSARLTWLQAKVTASAICHPHPTPTPSAFRRISFGANLEQWDLLGHRPAIGGATTRFQPPADLLSAAILPSVGSFGVFYPQGSGFNMAYFVGDCLAPLHNNAGPSGTLCFHALGNTRRINNFDEATATCCLFCFGLAIEAGLIGTPVRNLLSAGDVTAASVRHRWLKSMLRGLATQRPDSPLLDELSMILELRPDSESPDPVSPPARATVLLRYGIG